MTIQELELGAILKESLKTKGVSLRQLSKEVDIDVSTLSRVFNNKQKPNINHLEKLSKALELSLDELLIATGYNLNTQSKLLNKWVIQGKIEDKNIFEVCVDSEEEVAIQIVINKSK